MKRSWFEIEENREIAAGTYSLTAAGDTTAIAVPGQFVDVAVPQYYLRRPFSVCDWDEKKFRIVYKVSGRGTDSLSRMQCGEMLEVLTGLGNGFDMKCAGTDPVLVGGGSGISPLYGLAKRLKENGTDVQVLLGFKSGEDVALVDEFTDMGCRVFVSTEDGSVGEKGLVTEYLPRFIGSESYVYCCGPDLMMKSVWNLCGENAQFSLEAHMGCGFGACMGCSIQTAEGTKRVCKDGPVFKQGELLWQI